MHYHDAEENPAHYCRDAAETRTARAVAHLFVALHDALTSLERKALLVAEEDAAAETDLAHPRINREEVAGSRGVRRAALD